MPKQNFVIARGIVHNEGTPDQKVFKPGEEEELAKAYPKEQIETWKQDGTLLSTDEPAEEGKGK